MLKRAVSRGIIRWKTACPGSSAQIQQKIPVPAAVQLLEASKVKSGSAEPNRKKVGSVTWDQVTLIAQDKMNDLNAFTLDSAISMVAGTARSMGLTVTGTPPDGIIAKV